VDEFDDLDQWEQAKPAAAAPVAADADDAAGDPAAAETKDEGVNKKKPASANKKVPGKKGGKKVGGDGSKTAGEDKADLPPGSAPFADPVPQQAPQEMGPPDLTIEIISILLIAVYFINYLIGT
jgi:hypothetical protein